MDRGLPDRRLIFRSLCAQALLAGLPVSARSQAYGFSIGSAATRLAPSVYVPPTSMAAVADMYRRMSVSVRVDNSEPFPFVIDTGANQSVISSEIATQVGLVIGPTAPLNGVAGVENAPTTVADLRFGGEVQRAVPLSILPASAIGGPGLLGVDRLADRELTLDFRDRELRISQSSRSPRGRNLVTLKAHRRDGQLTLVDADLAGIPIIAFLDSGAECTIGNKALRGMAEARMSTDHFVNVPIVSVTGQRMQGEMANLPNLRIGGLSLPNWPVAFADLHVFKMWNMVERPALLIGIDILSRFQSVSLDYARNEVRFMPPPPLL